MERYKLKFRLLPGSYAVVRLAVDTPSAMGDKGRVHFDHAHR